MTRDGPSEGNTLSLYVYLLVGLMVDISSLKDFTEIAVQQLYANELFYILHNPLKALIQQSLKLHMQILLLVNALRSLPYFKFLFSFAVIMILTCTTTTKYTCLFPCLQIKHSSMEHQLLPAVQYANYRSFARRNTQKSVQYSLS